MKVKWAVSCKVPRTAPGTLSKCRIFYYLMLFLMPQRQVIKGKALMADKRAKSNQSHSMMARDGSSFNMLCCFGKASFPL